MGSAMGRNERAVGRLRGEGGLTLIEMLVAMAIAMALLVPTVLLITTTQNHASGDITRSNTVAFASTGLREMDQELRQAYEIEFPTGSTSGLGATATTGPTVTGEGNITCTETSAGAEPCNVIDVLTRLTGTGLTTAPSGEFEVRYDCSIPSTTITGDKACWRYVCAASPTTAGNSSCTTSTGFLSSKLVIDDLVNGTSLDQVFSLCYPSVSGSQSCSSTTAPRPTSASVTLKLPSTGTQATNRGGDPSVVYLTDGIYFPGLDLNQ